MGQGKQVMMFAHGFGCDQHMWRFITPAFEKDYNLVLFDYVGAGKSDTAFYNQERYASLQGYAQDVLDICERFKSGTLFRRPLGKQHDRATGCG